MYRAEVDQRQLTGRTGPSWLWAPSAALLMAVYLTAQVSMPEFLPGDLSVLVLQPVLWVLVALISFIIWRYGLRPQPRPSAGILTRSLIMGLFQVGAWLLAGLAFGFGLSPYGHDPSVMLGNALFAGTALIGMEMARACIVVSLAKGSPSLALAAGAGLLTLLSIPVGQFGSLVDVPSLLRFSGEVLLPTLSQNLLASILALAAGPTAALLYRGLIVSFEWLFPILPDLQWIAAAFVGTMPAALGMLAVEEHLTKLRGDQIREEGDRARVPGAWLLAAVVSVTLLFFNAGGFGYRPTLIVGPSMRPAFDTGDIVVTAPVSPETLQVGDVIRFRTEEGSIVHRVRGVQRDEAGLVFITRGDGNNVDDPAVLPEQIEGRMVLLIPKVGWPALAMRKLLELLL